MGIPKTVCKLILFASVLTSTLNGITVLAEEPSPSPTPTPEIVVPTASPPPAENLLDIKASAKQKDDTYQYLNKRDTPNAPPGKEASDYESGKTRAQQMVTMLQNQEMTKALEKITGSGKKTLDENPEIKTPLAVIAGAASLWYGRTVKLIKGDEFNMSANVDGRDKRSEFSMGSPILNGKLRFDGASGMGIGLNRKITDINTEAGVQYNVRDQVMSTEIRQRLAPHLDLSFGASRIDQSTKIEYRLNF